MIELGPADVERIAVLERAAFVPSCQATVETLQARFALGHRMLGLADGRDLLALVGYFYTDLCPRSLTQLPRSERELGLTQSADGGKAVFVYNLEVAPARRGLSIPRLLLRRLMLEAKTRGAIHGFGTARVPSYAGSTPQCPQETVTPQPAFRAAIDRFLNGGEFPQRSDFQRDPVLSLYRKLAGCRFLAVLPNYAPADHASGGIRVLVYRSLISWP